MKGLLNAYEIRAYNDHIAQCFRKEEEDEFISKEVEKARRHTKRILLDCFKFLNIFYHDYVKKFEKQTRNIDLTLIGNGEFYLKYSKLRKESTQAVRNAKRIESRDNDKGLKNFEIAFNIYDELENLIENNKSNIIWARAKFIGKRGLKILLWLIAAIISGLISSLIVGYWENISKLIKSIF